MIRADLSKFPPILFNRFFIQIFPDYNKNFLTALDRMHFDSLVGGIYGNPASSGEFLKTFDSKYFAAGGIL